MTEPGPGRDRIHEEVAAELGHYLELRARALEGEGMTPEEARRAAELRFGDRKRILDECVAIQRKRLERQRRRSLMGGWGRDLVHATRGLTRTPVVTGAALITLALGIGANTAVFSVVRGVLLRPLPFPEPHELVALYETRAERGTISVAPANYLDWRARAGSFESMAAMMRRSANLLEGETPTRVTVGLVSGNFFATLDVEALLGRTFDPQLRIDPGVREVVLGQALWTSRFAGDPGIVGRTIRIDEGSYEVLGVARPGLELPEGVDLWMRAAEEAPGIPGFSGDITRVRTAWYFDVVGRLADGVSIEAAQSELDAIAAALRAEHPEENQDAGVSARPLHEDIVASSRSLLALMLGAVGLVLLAACANVANLFLVRAEGRRRDFAVRAALGAGGARLQRFVLTEGLILATLGGTLGAVVGAVTLPLLRDLLPAGLPRRGEIALDGWVLVFTVAVSLLTCLVFASAPAHLARRSQPARTLAGRAGSGGGRKGSWLRGALVVTEVALGVVLAAGTGLVVRSLTAMATVDPGFRTQGLATVRVSLPEGTDLSDEVRRERWRHMIEELAALPGVGEVGAGIASPSERGPQAGLSVVRGDPTLIEANQSVVWHPASPGYLEALGAPLLRGRAFDDGDRADALPVALVSEGLVRRFFAGEEPLGQRVTIGLDEGHETVIEVVGVVGDTRNRGPVMEPVPTLYRPVAQAGGFGGTTMFLAAHGTGDPVVLLRAVTDAIGRIDPTAVVYNGRIGDELDAVFFSQHRFVLSLLGLFAALAVGLAAVGIYGVTAHAVGRRRREIGIRMAMGATRGRVWSSVLAGGLRLALVGVAVGLTLAVLGGSALSSLLFQVEPTDPLTLGGVAVALLLVAALALALPAAQAVRIDPSESMRTE